MNDALGQLLVVLGLDGTDASKAAVLPDNWGFSSMPALQQLSSAPDRQRRATTDVERYDHNSLADETYVSMLESSPSFISNHCVNAMAEAYGLTQLTNSLSGSLMAGRDHCNTAAAAVQAIKQQVDRAWSAEAVRRGVGCAKSGEYQQALECYNKALELDPANCDAHVARGAAHANQKQFELAVADFKAALDLDPNNTNAEKYLQATRDHMQAAAAAQNTVTRSADARRDAVEQQQQQQQQQPPHVLNRDRQIQQDRGTEQAQHKSAREPEQQQMQDLQSSRRRSRRHSRSRSRSRGRDRSGSTSNSSSDGDGDDSSSGSDDEGGGYKLLRGSTAADIKKAIELVRSAKKASHKDRQKDTGSSKKNKKKRRHKQKHSSKHKHQRRSHKGHKRSHS